MVKVIKQFNLGHRKLDVDGAVLNVNSKNEIGWMENWNDLDRLLSKGLVRRQWPKNLNLWTSAEHIVVE